METPLTRALYWLDHGVSPIPVYWGTKKPIFRWQKWMKELPRRVDVVRWFSNPETNIGICTGGKNQLVVLDFDDADYYFNFLRTLNPEWQEIFNNTYSVATSRGWHIYLYTNERTQSRKLRSISVDILSDGHFVLTPPSKHPSGSRYIGVNTDVLCVCAITSLFPKEVLQENHAIEIEKNPWIQNDDKDDFFFSVEELKQRIPMLMLANRVTRMTHSRNQYYIGRCPVHDDHNPSFWVDTALNTCKCYGNCQLSDKMYDIIGFWQAVNGMSFKDAVKDLQKLIV